MDGISVGDSNSDGITSSRIAAALLTTQEFDNDIIYHLMPFGHEDREFSTRVYHALLDKTFQNKITGERVWVAMRHAAEVADMIYSGKDTENGYLNFYNHHDSTNDHAEVDVEMDAEMDDEMAADKVAPDMHMNRVEIGILEACDQCGWELVEPVDPSSPLE